MNKEQIIDKILNDLPTRDVRGEMSSDEWRGWFEEAFDKGYSEALREQLQTDQTDTEYKDLIKVL